MFVNAKTLILVYKDEMLANQVKKLVETKDDISEAVVVGTRDDSIKIVPWTEKVWLDNKKKGTVDSKVLFLGNIKGVDKLIPILDIKFDKHGVKYGWAGDQAAVFSDVKALSDREKYIEFLKEISSMPIPEMIKNKNNTLLEETKDTVENKEEEGEPTKENEGEEKKNFFEAAIDSYLAGVNAMQAFFQKAGSSAADIAEDFLRDKSAIASQQMFYGILKLYNGDLEEFMQG